MTRCQMHLSLGLGLRCCGKIRPPSPLWSLPAEPCLLLIFSFAAFLSSIQAVLPVQKPPVPGGTKTVSRMLP
jgi:hypothetical protein